jgi:DNA repair protein RecO (recombination protein O)
MSRTLRTEAVVLRSFRVGEADRVLHLYTEVLGRVGAVAKGARRTKSRLGGRLEPFSHVVLMLHRGRGELHTVTGASLTRPHDRIRMDPYRLGVGLIGLEAMLRLFPEEERNERAFLAVTRFLDAMDDAPSRVPSKPALDPLVLSFQLKLLWVSGYLPHLDGCVECGGDERLSGYLPAAGGVVCLDCAHGSIPLSTDGLRTIVALLRAPIAEAPTVVDKPGGLRESLAVITASYEFQGGFRLRTATG